MMAMPPISISLVVTRKAEINHSSIIESDQIVAVIKAQCGAVTEYWRASIFERWE